MKSLSFHPSVAADDSYICNGRLSLHEAIESVRSASHGAIVTFSGCVREREGDEVIAALHYDVYRAMAELEFRKIVHAAEARWDVKVFLRHRVGRVPVGEPSVVVACSAVHRTEAFDACEFVIDELKKNVPIWKIRHEYI